MNKISYLKLGKIKQTLTESLSTSRKKSDNKVLKVFLESIESKFTLNEGLKENLDSLATDAMQFFKNTVENNKRVDYLLNIYKKVASLGGFNKMPALNKALEAFIKVNPNEDRLKELLKLWLEYLVTEHKEQSPLLTFNKEISFLSNALHEFKSNQSLQGANNNIDQLLSSDGLIYVLKKLASRLVEEAHRLHNNLDVGSSVDSEVDGDSYTDGIPTNSIVHDRFGDRKPKKLPNAPDFTKDLLQYQEKLQPKPSIKNRAPAYEAMFNAFLSILNS